MARLDEASPHEDPTARLALLHGLERRLTHELAAGDLADLADGLGAGRARVGEGRGELPLAEVRVVRDGELRIERKTIGQVENDGRSGRERWKEQHDEASEQAGRTSLSSFQQLSMPRFASDLTPRFHQARPASDVRSTQDPPEFSFHRPDQTTVDECSPLMGSQNRAPASRSSGKSGCLCETEREVEVHVDQIERERSRSKGGGTTDRKA